MQHRTTSRPRSRNLRPAWAAGAPSHWKTATFGWLALVVVAFAIGGAGRDEDHRPEHGGAGRVRPHGQDPRRRASSSPPARASSIQSSSLRDERSRLQGRDRRTSSPASPALDVVQNVRSPLDPAQRGPDREERARGARRVRDPRRRRQGRRQDRPRARPGRRGAAGRTRSSSSASSATRASVDARRDGLRRRPGEGRAALAPDHADHPRDRVRRARGRGHPAAARPDRRLRDVRADRAAEPGAADGARRPPRSCS